MSNLKGRKVTSLVNCEDAYHNSLEQFTKFMEFVGFIEFVEFVGFVGLLSRSS